MFRSVKPFSVNVATSSSVGLGPNSFSYNNNNNNNNRRTSSAMSIATKSANFLRCKLLLSRHSFAHFSGEWGSGAGKGGGSGGAVRDAGGIFGKMEAAREEEYFRKLQRKQLAKLKQHISEEILHHKKLIQQHKDAIVRLESRINELKKSES